jgi:steroid delta-isomerase-like uncharacterized protein
MANVEQMKEIVGKHLKAFCSGDWNTYKQLLTEDCVFEEEPTSRSAEGPDEVVKLIEGWKRAFPDVQATLKQTVASGDAIVAEIEWSGTHKGTLSGPLGDIPATNKKGKIAAVEVARFEGDKIREVRHYFDLLSLFRQLGISPQQIAGASAKI